MCGFIFSLPSAHVGGILKYAFLPSLHDTFILLFLFSVHRQTSHHIHHPLSTHLPLPHKSQKRLSGSERKKKKKKKRKPKKTSVPPSNVTPTIQEVEEEEEEDEEEGESEGEDIPEKDASAESDLEASSQAECHGKLKRGLGEENVEVRGFLST